MTFHGTPSVRILIGMITNRRVLAGIDPHWTSEQGLFPDPWQNLIGRWCIDYYRKHRKAPRRGITVLYERWLESKPDPNLRKGVERMLEHLNNEHQMGDVAAEVVLDTAKAFFRKVRLRELADRLQEDLDADNLAKAEGRVAEIRLPDVGSTRAVDVLLDDQFLADALDFSTSESLVKYGGPLGEFFGDDLSRDSFVAFMAPEKRGKSFWLLDVAWRAMLARKRVAFFEAGDMTQQQVGRRIVSRATGRPLRPGTVYKPRSIGWELDKLKVERESVVYEKGLSLKTTKAAIENLVLTKLKTRKSLFRLACYPNSTLNVHEIQSQLELWEQTDGYAADVVVIDYADILAPMPGAQRYDMRDRINENWKAMRGLSQARHCLVVTATQSDAKSYDVPTISRRHFSDDKRKYAHVTAMIGINQTLEEQAQEVQRLNMIVRRSAAYNTANAVTVAGCLAIGNPACRSVIRRRNKESE